MDSDYILNFSPDHPELNLSAADIEAIGGLHIPPNVDERGEGQNSVDPDIGGPGHGPSGYEAHQEDFMPEQMQDEHVHEHEQMLLDVEGEEGGDGEGGSSKRMTSKEVAGMSEEEKKRRQRDSNRKAAEKSRAKRRRDQDSTEVQIGHLRKENEKLRARLAALQQSTSNPDVIEPNFSTLQPIPSLMTPQPEPIEPKEIGIDRTYTSRLHTELSNAKSLLLDKYTELDRVRGREVEEEVLEQRRGLLGRHNGLIMLRAEEGAYNAVLGLLREETAELGEKGRVIAAELEKRGIQVPDKPADPPTEQEVPVSEGVDEETSRAHTQTLAQAVRDVAMTEAREMRTGDEHPGEEDEGVTEKDVYDIQPYIEQAVKWQQQQHQSTGMNGL